MPAFAGQAASAYRQTEVQSRTPLELVVMMYDGALRFMAQARDAIERKDIHARQKAVSRALTIISELQSTLDMEKGGIISEKLDSLYVYINGRLIDASSKQDARPIEEATRLLTTLRDSWAEIARETAATAPGRVTR
jgi:flagellar protein FliS